MKQNTKKLTLRLSEKEYGHLKAQAEAAGLKLEPLLRQMVQCLDIKPRPPDVYGELLQMLMAIERRLREIAHIADTPGGLLEPVLQEAVQLARDTWRLVKETL